MAPSEFALWHDIQEIVGSASLWPQFVRKLFWTPNLRHFQRVLLATFVFVNGLEASLFLNWVAVKHLAGSRKAVEHLEYLLRVFEDNPNKYKLYAYNVAMNNYQYLDGTTRRYLPRNERQ